MKHILVLSLASVAFLTACGQGFKATSVSTIADPSSSTLASVDEIQVPNQTFEGPAEAPPELIYNFVAATKADCENAIQQRLGTAESCYIGRGCSLDGFVPDNSHPSANPGHFGACVNGKTSGTTKAALPQTQESPAPVKYNVVAGDQATCDASARGIRAGVSCSIGGGCALNGGNPTNSNPSANPGLFGVCF